MSQVNALVDRFFEAKKMMSSMAGRFGLSNARRASKSRKGKKGKTSGRGPTPPKMKGLPPGALAGLGGTAAGMPGSGASGLPGGLPGLDQLPPGFDLSKIKLPKGSSAQARRPAVGDASSDSRSNSGMIRANSLGAMSDSGGGTSVVLRVTGVDAATGEPVDLWMVDGARSDGPIEAGPGVEVVRLTGFVLPGFVDAHCHVGYSMAGRGRY